MLAPILALLAAVSSVPAQAAGGAGDMAFPLRVVAELGADGLELALDDARLAALAPLQETVLVGVPWPGPVPGMAPDTAPAGAPLTLELERVRVLDERSLFHLDGRPLPALALSGHVQLWAGAVRGEPDSDVYLAFAGSGSRGWIRRGDAIVHLLAEPSPGGTPTQRLVAESRLIERGWSPAFACGYERFGAPVGLPSGQASAHAGGGPADGGPTFLPLLECRIAIETDTQYTQHFDGWEAGADYLVSLVGAVSARYREQIGIVFTIEAGYFYLGPDPWTTQETGGDGIELLLEFIDGWDGGAAPVEADVYFFMSGTSIVPSVGAFEGICSPDWGFALGTGMNGSTPFPVVQGPLTWNYTVMAHELGHVFGALHTHDYCPPIDQCSGSFGPCQTEQVCQTDGTVMSYCHQCPGGAANYTTFFHPFLVDVIRNYAEQRTCLQPFHGTLSTDLGSALAGASGTPHLAVDFDVAQHELLMEFSSSPASAAGAIVVGLSVLDAPFKGGTMVPFPHLLVSILTPASSAYTYVAGVPTSPTWPAGVVFPMQTWFVDAGGPAGFAATNGVLVELVLPDPPPPPVWIAHPSNGREYSLSNVGTYASARAQALSLGGELASIDDAALNAWLVSTFSDGGTMRSVYVGYSDAAVEGVFTWEDGSPTGFTNWGTPQPNDDSASGQDHVELMLRDDVLAREENDPTILAGQWNDALGSGWKTNRGLMERAAGP